MGLQSVAYNQEWFQIKSGCTVFEKHFEKRYIKIVLGKLPVRWW
jgi:hypothetical protein